MATSAPRRLLSRVRAAGADRGETPMGVMMGLVVFALVALSAGPALVSFTSQSASTSNDRRADKALAVLVDSARRAPWGTLTLGGPDVQSVTLSGYDADVATWIEPVDGSATLRRITMATTPFDSTEDCTSAATPAALPSDCIVRTATVAATATDVRPPSSPLADPLAAASNTSGADIAAGTELFAVTVSQPTRVSVVARTSAEVTLNLDAAAITRAQLTMSGATGTGWRFANAVLCPSWVPGGELRATVAAPATVNVADLLVLTAPAPSSSCQ